MLFLFVQNREKRADGRLFFESVNAKPSAGQMKGSGGVPPLPEQSVVSFPGLAGGPGDKLDMALPDSLRRFLRDFHPSASSRPGHQDPGMKCDDGRQVGQRQRMALFSPPPGPHFTREDDEIPRVELPGDRHLTERVRLDCQRACRRGIGWRIRGHECIRKMESERPGSEPVKASACRKPAEQSSRKPQPAAKDKARQADLLCQRAGSGFT